MAAVEDWTRRRFYTFMRARWTGTIALSGLSLLAALMGRVNWKAVSPAAFMLAAVVGYGLLLQWFSRWWLRRHPDLPPALLGSIPALDLLVLTALCHCTGGVYSLYVLIPLLYIVLIASTMGSKPAYLAALWTAAAHGGMVLLEVYGYLPLTDPLGPEQTPWALIYENPHLVLTLFLLTAGFFFLGAHVGSVVARRLHDQHDEISRLFQAAQGDARKMRLISELSRSLSAILDWPTLLARIFTELGALVSFDYAGLYLYEEESGQVRLMGTRGLSDHDAREAENTAMERHPGWVLKNQETLLVADTEQDPRIQTDSDRRYGSLIMVPLLYKERSLGALWLASEEKGAYSSEEQDLLEGLAGQLAVAVANAQLYEESRRAVEELRQAQEQLVRSARLAAVGELTAGLSHELNNPLGIVLGNVQLALETPGLDPEVGQSLQAIREAGDRIARMMRVLGDLELLRDERFEAIDVENLLAEALKLIERRVQRERVVVRHHIEPPLPRVWGSRPRLLQAVYNLLVNAIEAMQGQEQERELSVTSRHEDGEVVIAVRDTGPGVSAERLAHIFEPGLTTKVEEGRARGLGLGLFVSYFTVRAHGGELTVVSQEDSGTEATVRLPAMASQLQ